MVPDAAVSALETYMRLLARWNLKINLTALVVDPPSDAALDRLLLEPLAAARFFPEGDLKWMDLGSGGGSPAIPLKVARPAARLTMIESKARKAAFLREASRELGLGAADVRDERIEMTLGALEGRERPDLVTARAVKIDKRLFRLILSAMDQGGRLMVFASSAGAPPEFGDLSQVQSVPLIGKDAHLHVYAKASNSGQGEPPEGGGRVPRGTSNA